jgi:hypothetical protein
MEHGFLKEILMNVRHRANRVAVAPGNAILTRG